MKLDEKTYNNKKLASAMGLEKYLERKKIDHLIV